MAAAAQLQAGGGGGAGGQLHLGARPSPPADFLPLRVPAHACGARGAAWSSRHRLRPRCFRTSPISPHSAPSEQVQEDYDYDYASSDGLAADYSYYFEGGEDYSTDEADEGAGAKGPAPPPKKPLVVKAGRRSLVE